MNFSENDMVHLLAGKDNLHQATFQDLEELNTRYPYFSTARLLLAKKMKTENHPQFLQQVQKTAIYFPNPFWLHYQLIHEEIFTQPGEKLSERAKEDSQPVPVPAADARPSESPVTEEESPGYPTEEPFSPSDPYPEEQPADQPVNPRIAQLLKEQAEGFHKPVDETASLPPIEAEPYYTVDYFASQGIRLDANAPDKLGTQVRRFTDWLKQMKRLNPQPADLGTSPEMEHQVRNIAASSNEPREVLTEAMAEVLVKQGKTDKAIQLYIKLSFLEPQKSAYFASRIQELKGI